ncbi:MAG: hypothetical protein KDC05_16190, partial [Bacteroidales bacterium]|nr:hypothetical protein [Bacteroidales bacterium]
PTYEGWDFTNVWVEDVAGNNGGYPYFGWQTFGPTLPEPVITIENPTSSSCGQYTFEITAEDFTNVGGISLTLDYDPAVLEYSSSVLNGTLSSAGTSLNDVSGQIIAGGFYPTPITLGNDVLFSVTFNLKPAISGTSTLLSWSTADPADNDIAGPNGLFSYTSTFNDLSWTIPVRPVKNLNTSFEYCTIQSAIDAASSGDVIEASAGTYPENLTIGKSISLIGPNNAVSPNTGTRVAEAILEPPAGGHAITGAASDITVSIKGFTLDMVNTATDNRFLDQVGKSGTSWTIENNIFKNAASCGTGNMRLTGVLNTGLIFNLIDNYFTNNDVSNGISIWDAPFTTTIQDNVWEDTKGWALNLNQVTGTIQNNTFIDNDPSFPDDTWYNNQNGVIIADNNNNVQIIDNSFINNYSSLNIYENTEGLIEISGNFFNNNITYAIKIRDLIDPSQLNFTANNNSFTGTVSGGFAFQNLTDPLLAYWPDVTCNWFETSDPFAIDGLIDGYANVNPFLTDGTDNEPGTPGFQPVPLSCDGYYPVHNLTQDTYYLTIQSAEDDADPNDVIEAAAGTYIEQVLIDVEGLTIQGVGTASTIIQSPASLALSFTTSKDQYAIVCAHTVNSFTLKNLTIDGFGQGNANYSFVGLAFWNSGGQVMNVDITGVRDTPFSGAQHGVSVYAYNNTGGPYTLAINGVNVTDFQKNAFALNGTGLTVDLDNIYVQGAGQTNVTAQNGIQLSYGPSGTMDNCTIEDIWWTGATWTASGVLLYQSGSITSNNIILNNTQTAYYAYQNGGNNCNNVDVDGSKTSFNIQDCDAYLDYCDVTNPVGDGIYVYCSGSKTGKSNEKSLSPSVLEENGSKGDPKASAIFILDNAVITGTGLTDSWGVTMYGEGTIDGLITNSHITNWDWGVVTYDFGNAVINSTVEDNDLSGNTSYGFFNNCAAVQNAKDNWWGGDVLNSAGPYHPVTNTCGDGSPVSDDVDYYEWWADDA